MKICAFCRVCLKLASLLVLDLDFATARKEWIANMEAIIGRENLSSPTPSFIAGMHILKNFLEKPSSYEWVCRVLAERLTIPMEEVYDYLMLPRNGIFGALYALVRTGQMLSGFPLFRFHGAKGTKSGFQA